MKNAAREAFVVKNQIKDKKAHALFRLQGNLRNKEVEKFINSEKTSVCR